MSKTIAVLLTVFNRKEGTLRCLANLHKMNLPDECRMDVYLTNDGCTDGTPEAVRGQFPEVNVIDGDGTLYWNRGMYTAWEAAAKAYDYDYYLWLNDDTFLFPNCIEELIDDMTSVNNQAIVVATIRSRKEERTTYGGHVLKGQGLVVPNGQMQECRTMNGNCVLIPREVFRKCGNLDWTFRHAIGDLDYGYRARKAGFKVYSSKEWLGYCENNPKLPAWARPEVPFLKRVKNLYSPLGYAEPLPFFHYELRNFGVATAMKHFITINIRVCFPYLWKK